MIKSANVFVFRKKQRHPVTKHPISTLPQGNQKEKEFNNYSNEKIEKQQRDPNRAENNQSSRERRTDTEE